MTQSIYRTMMLYITLSCIFTAALFSMLGIVGVEMAGDALLKNKLEQMTSVMEGKKNKVEDFFEEQIRDMLVLLQTLHNMRESASKKLESIQQLKTAQIEDFLKNCRMKTEMTARMHSVIEAFYLMSSAYQLEAGDLESGIFRIHRHTYNNFFQQILDQTGFLNLFLINASGNIIYAAKDNGEIGKNVENAPLKETSLAHCFLKGLSGFSICDYRAYPLDRGNPAAFVSAPVKKNDQTVGVLVFQLSIAPLNDILKMRKGLGETTETLLIGRSGETTAFRCDLTRDRRVKARLGQEVDLPLIEPAFSGRTVDVLGKNHEGRMSLIHAAPVRFEGLNWACVSSIEFKEAVTPETRISGNNFFHEYIRLYGFSDLFLILPSGEIIYSINGASQIGQNVKKPPFADSPIGKLVDKVLNYSAFTVMDYAPAYPFSGEPAAFIGQPVTRESVIELILVLTLPVDVMNRLMAVPEGMGKTGRTYVVGSDHRLRSDYIVPGNHRKAAASLTAETGGEVTGPTVLKALYGDQGAEIIEKKGGGKIISAYAPFYFGEHLWAVMAEIDADEVIESSGGIRSVFSRISGIHVFSIVLLASLVFVLVVLIITTLRLHVLKPLASVTDAADRLAAYDLTVTLDARYNNEIGVLFKAVRQMTERLRDIIFRVSETADALGASARKIAGEMSEQAAVATQQAASVSEISSTMEEYKTTSKQIAENAESVAEIARKTLDTSKRSVRTIERLKDKMENIRQDNLNNVKEITGLGKKTEEITKIMKFINNIAGQTKLIAFNAAIEASAAGTSGKRFSVVAGEIRRLADSVTESTGEIEYKIREIRNAAHQMVITSETGTKGVEEGIALFGEADRLFNEIFAGSNTTDAAARQISLSTQQQKNATEQVVSALKEIDQGARQTSVSIGQINRVVRELNLLSEDLETLMGAFQLGEMAAPEMEEEIETEFESDAEEDAEWEDGETEASAEKKIDLDF